MAKSLSPELERLLEQEAWEKRVAFASGLVRPHMIISTGMMVLPGLLWLFSGYSQFFGFMVSVIPALAGGGLFIYFQRQGRPRRALYAFVLMFQLMPVALSVVMPEIMPSIAIANMVLIALAVTLLGRRSSLPLVALNILAYIALFPFAADISQALFVNRVDDTATLVANMVIGFAAAAVSAAMIRIIVSGQEEASMEARIAGIELAEQAESERQQREALQQTVEAYGGYLRRVAAGNLSEQLVLADADQETDPLVALGMMINETVVSLQEMIARMRESANAISAAAAEILAATTQQIASATEQEAAVTQTMTTVEEVRTTVTQTAERAQSVADSASQSVQVSASGEGAVSDSVEGMRLIQERVTDIANTILALSERTQQIGEIINTVNEIADQSKLLALNASIEAARAGEEGRGFAVVAMEVRQLAEQSRQATSRVADILNEIQQATNTAVMVTEEGSKQADSGASLVHVAGEAIRELAVTLETSAQAATQIAASTHQQTNGMDQLMAAIETIQQATAQTAASTQQAERSAQALNEMASQMETVVAQYQV
jgi:methyl-accepting chemotaxis protein